MTEDELIQLIASLAARPAGDVAVALGDDAAVVTVPASQSLVTCTDTLVAGVHFHAETPAHLIGFKSLSVNLSDLAAMGALPRWVQLCLTMPAADGAFVAEFMRGFMQLADRYSVILVGGDTTRGPLSITVQAMGLADKNRLLTRGTAAPGDLVAVSGQLGDAALALQQLENGRPVAMEQMRRLQQPEPRIELGMELAGLASSCIDISDGLLLDLERLLLHSGCGASLELEKLPASECLLELEAEKRWQLQLTGGDDYELCFTIKPEFRSRLEELAESLAITITVIGSTSSGETIRCFDRAGTLIKTSKAGFQHFQENDKICDE
jgi:thiamine-monophosphate kinase